MAHHYVFRELGTLTLEELKDRFERLYNYKVALNTFMIASNAIDQYKKEEIEVELKRIAQVIIIYTDILSRYKNLYEELKALTLNQLLNEY